MGCLLQGKRAIVWQEQEGQRSVIHLHQQQHHLPSLQVRLPALCTLVDNAVSCTLVDICKLGFLD